MGNNFLKETKKPLMYLQIMRQFGKTIEEAKSRVPSAQDRLNMLQEYEVPETQPDAEATILQIRHKYNEVMRYSLTNRIKTMHLSDAITLSLASPRAMN